MHTSASKGSFVAASIALLSGCGSTAAPKVPAPAVATPLPAPVPQRTPTPTPTSSEGEPPSLSALPTTGSDGTDSVDGPRAIEPPETVQQQVRRLRRAIFLYEQFIARADGDPRFAEAVARSRDRIDDAKATILFLEGSSP